MIASPPTLRFSPFDVRAFASHLRERLRQAFARVSPPGLLLALLLAAPAARGQVELQVPSGTVASGGLTEVRYRFTERPTTDWRFSVDEAEGGTFAITRAGSVFYRAPRVAEPRTFHLRFSDSKHPDLTGVCPVQVLPDVGPSATSARSAAPQDAAPSAATAPRDAAPRPASDPQGAQAPGPATLVLDWDSFQLDRRYLRNASALITALCYLARDLGCARIDKLQVLSGDPEVLGSAAPRGGAERTLLPFEGYPHARVALNWQDDGTLGPGTTMTLQDLVDRGRLLLLVSARPQVFQAPFQDWADRAGATLVVVDATGAAGPQEPGPATGSPADGAPRPLTFRLQDLPNWLPDFAAPRTESADLQRSLEAQTLAPHARQLATDYLARQRRFAPWREYATIKAQVPSVGFLEAAVGPTPVKLYLDWDTIHVKAKDIAALLRGIRAFVFEGRAGLDPSPCPIQVYGFHARFPPAAMAALRAAGCQFHHLEDRKPSSVRFGLQQGLDLEGRSTAPDRARELICLVGGSRDLEHALTGLAMRGHRILTVVHEQLTHLNGWPLAGLVEDTRKVTDLPHLEGVASELRAARQARKGEALNLRTTQSALRFTGLGGALKAPGGLCLDPAERTLLCLDGGDLWQVHLKQHAWTNLTALSAKVNSGQGLPPLRSVTAGPGGRLYGATLDGRLVCVDRQDRYRTTLLNPAWAGPNPGADQVCLDAGHRLWFTRPGTPAPLACLDLDRPLPDGRYPATAIPASALLAHPDALTLDADGNLLYADVGARLFGSLQSGPEGWRPTLLAAWPKGSSSRVPHFRAIAGDTDGSLLCLEEGDGSLHRLSPRAERAPEPPQDGPRVWSELRTQAVPGSADGVRPSLALDPVTSQLFLTRGGRIGGLTLEVPGREQVRPSANPSWKRAPCLYYQKGDCEFQYHPEWCLYRHDRHPSGPAGSGDAGSAEGTASLPVQRPAAQPRVLILMDAQNVSVSEHNLPAVIRALRAFATGPAGAASSETCVVRVFMTNHPQYESRREAFLRAGCEVEVCPHDVKDSVDKAIIHALSACCDAFDPAQGPKTLCLVSGDTDFREAMRRAHMTGYRVLLVYSAQNSHFAQDPMWAAALSLYDLPGLEPLAKARAGRHASRTQEGMELLKRGEQVCEPLVAIDGASTRPQHGPGGMALETARRLLFCDGPLLKRFDLEDRLLSTVTLPAATGGAPDLLEVAVTGPGKAVVAHADGVLEAIDLDRAERHPLLAFDARTRRPHEPRGRHLCLDRRRRLWFTEVPGHRLGYLELARPDAQGRWPVRFLPSDPLLPQPTLKGLDDLGNLVCWDASLRVFALVRTHPDASSRVSLLHRWPEHSLDGQGVAAFSADGERGLLVACKDTGSMIRIDLGPGPGQGGHAPLWRTRTEFDHAVGNLVRLQVDHPSAVVQDTAPASFYLYTRKGLYHLYRKPGEARPPVPEQPRNLPPVEPDLLTFKASLSPTARTILERQAEPMQARIMKEVQAWLRSDPYDPKGNPANVSARVVHICNVKNKRTDPHQPPAPVPLPAAPQPATGSMWQALNATRVRLSPGTLLGIIARQGGANRFLPEFNAPAALAELIAGGLLGNMDGHGVLDRVPEGPGRWATYCFPGRVIGFCSGKTTAFFVVHTQDVQEPGTGRILTEVVGAEPTHLQ